MPLDDEENIDNIPLKNILKVSGKPSMFEKQSPSSREAFNKKVDSIEEKTGSYKEKAAELAVKFKKMLDDTTLAQNKNPFQVSLEKETLSKMVELAIAINNDELEQEGMGSLSWITLLLKTVLYQRDKINNLEFQLNENNKTIKSLGTLESKFNEEMLKIQTLLQNK